MEVILRFDEDTDPQPTALQDTLSSNRLLEYGKYTPPIWGIVEEVFPDSTVTVRLTSGIRLHHVIVPASIYVQIDSQNQALQGGRQLPPVGSEVLVIFPYGAVEEAVILCSRLPRSNESIRKDFFNSDVNIDIEKDRDGWESKKDRTNGILTIENGSFKVKIDLNNKEASIEDGNGNKILLNSSGIKLITGDATAWKPCIIQNCLWNGAPHGGNAAGIQKLTGG